MVEHRSHKSKAEGSSPSSAIQRLVHWLFSKQIERIAKEKVDASVEEQVVDRYPSIVEEVVERRAARLADELVADFWGSIAPAIDQPAKKDLILDALLEVSKATYTVASEIEKLRTGDISPTTKTGNALITAKRFP